jgi:3-dehydroquinate synthase
LAAEQIDRHSFVIVVGGGAVLDVAGYAAAVVHRGVRLVRIPTTVLAQNDAGVGVKNGINAFGAKNFLGVFAPPFAVIDDSRFLSTLDPRDQVAGMAEAVKVAAIRDPVFFEWLVDHSDALASFELVHVERMIRRCAELHLAHIAGGGDPFETGNARPLDFGHWSAHKLEILTAHELRHGEAVAIGMARRLIGLRPRSAGCRAAPPPPSLRSIRLLAATVSSEARSRAGIGSGVDCRDVQTGLVARSIGWLRRRAGR